MRQKNSPSRIRLVLSDDESLKVELRPDIKIPVDEVELLGGYSRRAKKMFGLLEMAESGVVLDNFDTQA